MISIWKYHKNSILFVVLSILFYWVFAYQLDRTDFPKLLSLYLGLFIMAYYLNKVVGHNFKAILILGLGFRFLFLLAIPSLSQDFYRFIWDGYLNISGISPYLHTPNELIASNLIEIPNQEVLYNGMGELSASNYSNYPPINQFCFVLANLVWGDSILSSVVGLRLLIILADVGILFVSARLLKSLDLPLSHLFWYFLNPFIIIELTGNLHFEGVMMFFFVLSLYLLAKQQIAASAISLGLSISVKLIPLMLLPLFFSHFTKGFTKNNSNWKLIKNYKPLCIYYLLTGIILALSFLPFLSNDFITNYKETIGLWFNNFEFNASIYYVLRGLGFLITGYNEIAVIGSILPLITLTFILYKSVFYDNSNIKNLIVSMLFVVSVYLFMSTTIHPWYLVTLVVLGMFTKLKYPIFWSCTVILSYYAYSQDGFKENYWLLALEYAVVLLVLIKELKNRATINGTIPHRSNPS